MPRRKPFLPGQLVRLESSVYRFCFLVGDSGNALATQIEIPKGCVLMVVSNYHPQSILEAVAYKDWGMFLAGEQLVVAQWRYFVQVKK